MNEITPPSDPGPITPSPASPQIPGTPPSKKFCAGLGSLLFVVTAGLSFVFPPMCLFGLAGAIASLFFPGYRCIFVGYILTIGIILLGLIIYCSNHPFEDR